MTGYVINLLANTAKNYYRYITIIAHSCYDEISMLFIASLITHSQNQNY